MLTCAGNMLNCPLEGDNLLLLERSLSLELILNSSFLFLFLLLSWESFDRDCCGGVATAMLDHCLGNMEFQPLQRAVICQ